jgi:hypothetical protein
MAAAVMTAGAAWAGTISKAEARNRVTDIQQDHEAILAKYPALAEIDQVVRDDCAAKVPGHTSSDSFCKCAGSVTMSLWRSGVDPKMIERLQAYVAGSGDLKAADFVRYEGPELYSPLCERAQ